MGLVRNGKEMGAIRSSKIYEFFNIYEGLKPPKITTILSVIVEFQRARNRAVSFISKSDQPTPDNADWRALA